MNQEIIIQCPSKSLLVERLTIAALSLGRMGHNLHEIVQYKEIEFWNVGHFMRWRSVMQTWFLCFELQTPLAYRFLTVHSSWIDSFSSKNPQSLDFSIFFRTEFLNFSIGLGKLNMQKKTRKLKENLKQKLALVFPLFTSFAIKEIDWRSWPWYVTYLFSNSNISMKKPQKIV